MERLQTDLLIIGAGPGGYVGALYAAKKGMKVTLVDKSRVGGVCLNEGCIPTKALVKSSRLYQSLLHSETLGISVESPRFDMNKIIDYKNNVKDKLVNGVIFLLERYNVKVIKGNATFKNNNTVIVSEEIEITAKDIIIATGSKTKHLPIPGINSELVVNSKWLLDNRKLPSSLTVIGGGVIGMEFAFIYANLGVQVNVLEFLPKVLPSVDSELSTRLLRYAKQLNMKIVTNAKVTEISVQKDKAFVHYTRRDKLEMIETDLVLEAVGRIPNMEGLGLENTDVAYDLKNGISVDKFMKTNVKNIYAIGDVTNIIQLAHVASHQAMVAIDNILGEERRFSMDAIPAVIFTSPEIATVGKTESYCKENNLDYEVVKVPFSANGKALINGSEMGYMKLIQDRNTKVIIGGMIFGDDAENLIAPITIAIQNKLTSKDLSETIFAHPTMPELIHEASLGLNHLGIHFID
ncbi:MAG: dihydrolipoyl dehydrogenase [Tenericutes bacterium 4572_104]|nr:MAG: dihydrolipoyl dehydrogenase [Tenericutes bacterium 4572_104]